MSDENQEQSGTGSSNVPSMSDYRALALGGLGVHTTHVPKTANYEVNLDDIPDFESADDVPSQPVINHGLQEQDSVIPAGQLMMIKHSLIDTSPYQPRDRISDKSVEKMAEMLKASGKQKDPIQVRLKSDGRYELIDGERRWRGVGAVGWDYVLAEIVDGEDEAEVEVDAALLNLGREGLSDYEKAKTYQRLKKVKKNGVLKFSSDREMGRHLGVGHVAIHRCLSYFSLPEFVLQMLDDDNTLFGATTARDLAVLYKQGLEANAQELIENPDAKPNYAERIENVIIHAVQKLAEKRKLTSSDEDEDDGMFSSENGIVNWAKGQAKEILTGTHGVKIQKEAQPDAIAYGSAVIKPKIDNRKLILDCGDKSPAEILEKFKQFLKSNP